MSNLKKYSLHFRNTEFEKKYQEHQLDKNKFPGKKLLYFNFLLYIMLSITYYLNHQIITIPLFSLCYLPILLIIFLFYWKTSNYRNLWQSFYLIFSILVPFIFGTVFLVNHLYYDLGGKQSSGIDLYILGYCFSIYHSYLYLFQIRWYHVCFLKLVITLFLVSFILIFNNSNNGLSIILLVLILFSLYFDYKKDVNDRHLFYTEYLFSENFENLKKIFEEIPDLVIIWKKNGLTFANKSTFNLFNKTELFSLQSSLLQQIEVQELQSVEDGITSSYLTSNFLNKILEILNSQSAYSAFKNFSGVVKFDTSQQEISEDFDRNNIEFDIKMKKIYWGKDVCVMILLTKVDEIQLKTRLNLVNSFLTKVLGQVSHEMHTPLHILLGIMDEIKRSISDEKILKDVQMVKNAGQILLHLIRIIIDIFHIRKGSLMLEITKINVKIEINEILVLFEEILNRKQIKVMFTSEQIFLQTDSKRFRQIMVSLLNKVINQMESGNIIINFSSLLHSIPQFFKITINIENKSPDIIHINDIKVTTENSSPLLKIEPNFQFSMIDYLILCLSCGQTSNSDRNNLLKSTEELKMTSSFRYWFQICNIESQESIKIKDPFKENFHFRLNLKFSLIEELSSIESNDLKEPLIFKKIKRMMSPKYKKNNLSMQISSPISFHQIQKKYKHTILNVDDIYLCLIVISNYCKAHNLSVDEAENGLEALNKVKQLYHQEDNTYDLIFMDCDMPIMDGFDSAKNINEFYTKMSLNKPIIIAVTANIVNNEILTKIEESGMKEMVQKPFSCDKFKEVLKKYLNYE